MKSAIQLAAALLLAASGPALADKTTGDRVDDGWLHTKVKTALIGHGSTDINIEVYHGVVQLAGFLNSETKKQAALDAAAGVKGVVRVGDSLVVAEPGRSTGRTLDDNTLAARVKGTITNDDFSDGVRVNVEVNRGNVLVSGFVSSEETRSQVVELVQGVEGVEKVINGMEVKPEG